MRCYPASFTPEDDGGFSVTFRDVPEAITQGDTIEDAFHEATDALVTALDFYVEARKTLPVPSAPEPGERPVPVSPLAEAKLSLFETMLATGVGKAELGRRLGVHFSQVDRLLSLLHNSKLDQIERALSAVGKRLEIVVRDAA